MHRIWGKREGWVSEEIRYFLAAIGGGLTSIVSCLQPSQQEIKPIMSPTIEGGIYSLMNASE